MSSGGLARDEQGTLSSQREVTFSALYYANMAQRRHFPWKYTDGRIGTTVAARLHPSTKQRLDDDADRQGRSVAVIVGELLEERYGRDGTDPA
jgi:hypothetical protein